MWLFVTDHKTKLVKLLRLGRLLHHATFFLFHNFKVYATKLRKVSQPISNVLKCRLLTESIALEFNNLSMKLQFLLQRPLEVCLTRLPRAHYNVFWNGYFCHSGRTDSFEMGTTLGTVGHLASYIRCLTFIFPPSHCDKTRK